MRIPIVIDTATGRTSTETGKYVLGYTMMVSSVQNHVLRGTFERQRYDHFNVMKQLNGIA